MNKFKSTFTKLLLACLFGLIPFHAYSMPDLSSLTPEQNQAVAEQYYALLKQYNEALSPVRSQMISFFASPAVIPLFVQVEAAAAAETQNVNPSSASPATQMPQSAQAAKELDNLFFSAHQEFFHIQENLNCILFQLDNLQAFNMNTIQQTPTIIQNSNAIAAARNAIMTALDQAVQANPAALQAAQAALQQQQAQNPSPQ